MTCVERWARHHDCCCCHACREKDIQPADLIPLWSVVGEVTRWRQAVPDCIYIKTSHTRSIPLMMFSRNNQLFLHSFQRLPGKCTSSHILVATMKKLPATTILCCSAWQKLPWKHCLPTSALCSWRRRDQRARVSLCHDITYCCNACMLDGKCQASNPWLSTNRFARSSVG